MVGKEDDLVICVKEGGEPGAPAVEVKLGETAGGKLQTGQTRTLASDITVVCDGHQQQRCGFKGSFTLRGDGRAQIVITPPIPHTCTLGGACDGQAHSAFDSQAAAISGASWGASPRVSRPLHRPRPGAGMELRLGRARSIPIWSACAYREWYEAFRLPRQGLHEDARTVRARTTNAVFNDPYGLGLAHLQRRFDVPIQNSFLAQHIFHDGQPAAITVQGRLPLLLTNRELLDIIKQHTGILSDDARAWARQGYPGCHNVAVVMDPRLTDEARKDVWSIILAAPVYLSRNGHKLPSEPANQAMTEYVNAVPRAILIMLRAGHPDIPLLRTFGFRVFDRGVQYTFEGVPRKGYEDVTVFLVGIINHLHSLAKPSPRL